jgi:hypothetical protein
LKYPSRWLRSPIPAATLRLALASNGITITDMAATVLSMVRRFACRHRNKGRSINTKQKTVIGVGLAAVIAMAAYPPWATWCIPVDHKTLQYGWIFGRLNYPECAEKLPWTWDLATDRLLLQWGLVIGATVALTLAFRSRIPDEQGLR